MTTITAIKNVVGNNWSLIEGQTLTVDDSFARARVQEGHACITGDHIAETYSEDITPRATEALGDPCLPTQRKRGRPRKSALSEV